MIIFNNFSFQYNAQAKPTLHNIDLHIRRGEKILITGSSGSGKSTLLHCINGMIPHAYKGKTTGALMLNGKPVDGMSIFDFSQQAGTVLQDTDGQFVALTAAEDIAFAAENDCVSVDELHRRVIEAAKLVHIENHLDKAPHDLSGGQKQRVSLAGVLMMNTDILLFDEPLANLDPASGAATIELIDELRKETGKTIIIIEHRLEEVLHRHVDRVIVIKEGWIASDTPPAALLASSLLPEYGIREPLYVSALRYAGCLSEEGIESVRTAQADTAKLERFVLDGAECVHGVGAAFSRGGGGNSKPLLAVENLSFSYDNDPAVQKTLDNISFTVNTGDCVALAGRNGAGKSTLAKLLCGFRSPAAGRMVYNSHDLADLSIKQRAEHIGYVMQNPNQMISFPMIFDEVAFGLRNRNIPEKEIADRVADALDICGLKRFRKWPIAALSYGQKKRLTIASILTLGSSLLILDEPTAGQDLRHYTEIMEFLEKLREERNLTYILITHDMHLMLEYADRALVLSEGKLLAYDEPAAVLSNDTLIEAASLKRTSLYDLALQAGLGEPEAFIRAFIRREAAEKRKRGNYDAQ